MQDGCKFIYQRETQVFKIESDTSQKTIETLT